MELTCYSLLPTGAGSYWCQSQLCAQHLGFALVLRAASGAKSPLQAGSQSCTEGVGRMEQQNTQGLCFFVKCGVLFVFGVFFLFVNSLLFVWREILIFSKQTFSFGLNTAVFVLSICKCSTEFCGIFSDYSHCSVNLVSAEGNGPWEKKSHYLRSFRDIWLKCSKSNGFRNS